MFKMSGEDEKAQVESPEAEASNGDSKSEPQADDQNDKVANGDEAKDLKKKKAPLPKKSPSKKPKKKELSDDEGEEEKEEIPPKKAVKKPASPKKESKEVSKAEEEDDEEEEEEQSEKGVPLLDQPLEVSGSRERKKVARFEYSSTEKEDKKPFSVPEGKGTKLGEIPIIENAISKFRAENMKTVSKALFGSRGPLKTVMKKTIRSFNGYDFDEGSDQWEKRKILLSKVGIKQLKVTCEILGLERSGTVAGLTDKIMQFCLNPTDSGKKPPQPKSKRKSKGGSHKKKADSDSDAKPTRASKRSSKGKKVSLKDVSESDSDEDVKEDVKKESKSKKARVESSDDEGVKDESEKEESDKDEKDGSEKDDKELDKEAEESNDVTDEEKEEKKSKKGKKPASKVAPVKQAKKAPPKKAPAKKAVSESEDGASEDDEPLVKIAKPSPPTDEEIKSYVKKILEGANLEEITMKTVCKQVYENYPEHDLAHKKDLIKETVKSLISP
ncbi:hypothetical protein FOCC_FOCC004165 [Frankliniella occidentalis]|nr:hypothetical protein FOCC_FOCC004165 [Frankliniella occidentalis]